MNTDALVSWYVHEDESDDSKLSLAFVSLMNLDMEMRLSVNTTKYVNATIEQMNLSTFNVTQDNIGGGVKEDQDNIKYRLQDTIYMIEATANEILESYPLKFPEFQVIDYTMKFDYQDGAFGTGIMVNKKWLTI